MLHLQNEGASAALVELPLFPPYPESDFRYLYVKKYNLTLEDFLNSTKALSGKFVIDIIHNIVFAVAELHKYKVAHGNMHLRNFCVIENNNRSKDSVIKIRNFKNSTIVVNYGNNIVEDTSSIKEDENRLAEIFKKILESHKIEGWDEEMENNFNDFAEKIAVDNVGIESTQDHHLFWRYKRKNEYCSNFVRKFNQNEDKQEQLKEGTDLKVSVDDYPEDLKNLDNNNQTKKLLKEMKNIWYILVFIRNMFHHWNERKYPERRKWLNGDSENFDDEHFWKRTTGPWPQFLNLLRKCEDLLKLNDDNNYINCEL